MREPHARGSVKTTFEYVTSAAYRRDMTFKPNEDGIRAMYEEVASKIKDLDGEIRAQLAGQDSQQIKPEVKAAFARLGVELPDVQLGAYCDSVQNKANFEFVLN